MMDAEGSPALEPIVAHGSRMSWAGVLRVGDEFCRPRRSRRAVLVARSGPPLERYYGAWSPHYRRFTSNLSTWRIEVRVEETTRAGDSGVHSIVHWVDREALSKTGPGSVCWGDGWPVDLWDAFLACAPRLPSEALASKLREFLESDLASDDPAVREWREVVRGERAPRDALRFGGGWIPVPAPLEESSRTEDCIVSWSTSPLKIRSLWEVLTTGTSPLYRPDLDNQARYYLECLMATQHGVEFGPHDTLRDPAFERAPPVIRRWREYAELEQSRISDPRYGRFDQLG
jgi:hypothetical protein